MKITSKTFAMAAALLMSFHGISAAETPRVNANGMATAEAAGTEPGGDQAAELVKQLANPVASLISVPFQFNWDFNIGPTREGTKFLLNFQPVVPISIGKDYNLIIRTIVPFISQEDVYKPATIPTPPYDKNQTGLGDITQSFFLSPKKPVGGLILGFGPVFLYPSATDDLLGSEKWGAGPTLLVLKQTGGWTYGVLSNQIWSFAGDADRDYVSSTFLQPFLSYATKTKTTFGINSESTYNWHDSQWTVPFNLTVSQLVRLGKLPVQFTIGARYYAEAPEDGPNWGVRFVVTPLFPTSRPKPEAVSGTSQK